MGLRFHPGPAKICLSEGGHIFIAMINNLTKLQSHLAPGEAGSAQLREIWMRLAASPAEHQAMISAATTGTSRSISVTALNK
jgi:hypothetical protein